MKLTLDYTNILVGAYGVGKTGLCVALANDLANKLKGDFFNFATKHKTGLKTPIVSTFPLFWQNGLDKVKSRDLDPYKLAVNDKKEYVVSPYSVLVIDEAQIYYNSRGSMSADRSKPFEWSRHADYIFLLDTQRFTRIDSNIRDNAQVIEVIKREVFDIHGNPHTEKNDLVRPFDFSHITWHLRVYERGEIYERFKKLNTERKPYKSVTYTTNLNIFELYDCKGNKKHFRSIKYV